MPQNTVLTLLRSGALEQAEKEFYRLGLNGDQSSEDIMALKGRVLKAKALEASGAHRQEIAKRSAEAYGAAYTRFGGSFSGINTAALYLVAGDEARARATARQVQQSLETQSPTPGEGAYYHLATAAEAWLILGEQARAKRALEDAMPLDPHNYAAHASTLKQFDMLLAATKHRNDWLTPFRPPNSLHFAGHLFRLPAEATPDIKTKIYGLEKALDDIINTSRFGVAYGALAAGADIIVAERLLRGGVELHVVQPCPRPLFEDTSLTPYGTAWEQRYQKCLEKAASVHIVSDDNTVCDDLTVAYASETAMGLAALYAQAFATTAEQLVVWDGGAKSRTGRDASLWAETGRRQHVIPFPFSRSPRPEAANPQAKSRDLRAMLFADVQGFSKLSENQIPLFLEKILTPLAAVAKESNGRRLHVNTWGDGLFMVLDGIETAAKIACALQSAYRTIDLRECGLPEDMALRIGGHYGPSHILKDPYLQQDGFFGREVTIAARIEQSTVPGSIFVSEPFACALAARAVAGYRCERLPAPIDVRGVGAMQLFSLRKIPHVTEGD